MAASYAANTVVSEPYEKSATNGSATITPYDSGNILGTVPPGGTGYALIDGNIQYNGVLTAGQGSTNEANNFLACTSGVGLVPTVNAAQTAEAGLSMAPEHE